ncbi:MAG TPA: L-threonylcarbamoyladenylate synthase [Candidatus Sulfopaludibacter sp.]|nr:L-threonylcarbamoyladenylate synthase [Candidatus Sulfopaludibacter sp.]
MSIEHAAALIREGKLVAFPTETVYGLGANALDAEAVARIFQAKRRPRSSPLIVHVASIEQARELALEWSAAAEALARRFWPGPLTLVVPKQPSIPDIVTAGLATVGLRMPAHPLALELIRAAGVPVAAPSANRFTELSPTAAGHVPFDLADYVVDGGPARVGIESTVLSLAGPAELLRPGVIPLRDLEAVVGPIEIVTSAGEGGHASPGMHARHYRPQSPLYLWTPGDTLPVGSGVMLRLGIEMPADPLQYAAALYGTLHRLDAERPAWIAVEMPPDQPEWQGVLDRLRRAAA